MSQNSQKGITLCNSLSTLIPHYSSNENVMIVNLKNPYAYYLTHAYSKISAQYKTG